MANKATANAFTDYGEPFGLGDVITSILVNITEYS
jgi:hypothetical protein